MYPASNVGTTDARLGGVGREPPPPNKNPVCLFSSLVDTNEHVGGITWTNRGIKLAIKIETGEGLGVPNSTVRSGDLDDKKSREEES